MGRPRKKQDEETVQPDGEPKTDEASVEATPTEEVTAVVDETAEDEGTERVGPVRDSESRPEEGSAGEAEGEIAPRDQTTEVPSPAAPKPAANMRGSTPSSTPQRKSKAKPKRAERPKPKKRAAPRGERKPIVRLQKPEHPRGPRKERRGVVVSSAMDKTVVVRVETVKPDRRYKKVVRRSSKFHAHDERNEVNVGDVVRIVETRPLSKTKSWRVAEVIQAAR
jgi:small subunit ribosomal protein S17